MTALFCGMGVGLVAFLMGWGFAVIMEVFSFRDSSPFEDND